LGGRLAIDHVVAEPLDVAGYVGAEQRNQMSQRVERLSKMMHRMSGLQDRPALKGPELQKQMDQMRRQMDEMMRDPSMKSPAK
jgi:hypothetical protein